MPFAGAQFVVLCRRSFYQAGQVQLRQVQGARSQGNAHDGRHHRPGVGEGRADHREDRRRPRGRGRAPRRVGFVEKDPDDGPQGASHRPGHHGRGRHARRLGIALRFR